MWKRDQLYIRNRPIYYQLTVINIRYPHTGILKEVSIGQTQIEPRPRAQILTQGESFIFCVRLESTQKRHSCKLLSKNIPWTGFFFSTPTKNFASSFHYYNWLPSCLLPSPSFLEYYLLKHLERFVLLL